MWKNDFVKNCGKNIKWKKERVVNDKKSVLKTAKISDM